MLFGSQVAKLEALHSSSVADQQLADASNRELINSLTAKFKEAEGGRSRAELEAEGLRDKACASIPTIGYYFSLGRCRPLVADVISL